MGLTVDQQIQVWNAVGTWFAGLATFGAVVFSLFVLRRDEKVRLRFSVGLRLIVGGGSPTYEVVTMTVTNLANRPVIIVNLSWRVGTKGHYLFAVQTFGLNSPARPPTTLQHGETATFMVELDKFDEKDFWFKSMARLGAGRQVKQWDTLVCRVHTSVGQDVACKPEAPLIERIKAAQRASEK